MNEALLELIETSMQRYVGTNSDHAFGVPAASERRRKIVKRLLGEATNIIAEEGMAALTFRRLSSRCNMGGGNLQYYFPSSEELIHALIRFILAGYLQELKDGAFLQQETPQASLISFLDIQIEDIKRKKTNAIFIALWDLAQRDQFVAQRLEELYSVERALLEEMLKEIHPHEDKGRILGRAAAIASLLEGMMPLYGASAQGIDDKDEIYSAAHQYALLIAGVSS